MQATPTPSHSGQERWPRRAAHEVLAESVKRTAEALRITGAATEAEIASALAAASRAFESGKPVELLEWVARAQGGEDETVGAGILTLAEAIAGTLSPPPPLIPFAGKLIAPLSFYDTYTAVHQTAAVLMSPVIFAEDTDAIGVASVNPIAALILAEEILSAVDSRTGMKPFLTVARLDYESWTFLTRKHFGL